MFRSLYIISFLFLISNCFAQNPAIRGDWKGMLTSNSLLSDPDNNKGLPVMLTIIDDNNEGQIAGEMTVQYRYQTDVYKAKYAVTGTLDYKAYVITIKQEKFLFYDLLPKGLKWCMGSGKFNIYRSIYRKKMYMDGYMTSDCGAERMRMILVKM